MQNKTIVLTTVLSSAISLLAQKNEIKPNMVLFLADDCSYYDIGVYGSKDSKTPNIDKFAAEGMLFTKGYQAAPMSSPTRHNLFTGLWPVKTGAYPNHTMANVGTNSIVQHLRPAGYRIALIGKLHISPESVFPFEYVSLTKTNDIDFEAVDSFIASCTKSNTPFCLFVTSNQPHSPWDKGDATQFDPDKVSLPPFYVDTKKICSEFCKYLAEVNYMDNEFGKLLAKIDKYRQREKTAVVYLSEQGNSLPFAKWTCYEAGVHSAYLARWPGKIKPGSISNAIVEYGDITPTFVEIAGVKPVSKMDGKSIVSVLMRKEKEHKKYTFSIQTTRGIIRGSDYYGIRSVADKKFRYILNLTPESTFTNATIDAAIFKEWLALSKLNSKAKELTHKYQHRPAEELYNIENDPYCMINLAEDMQYAEVATEMDKVLKQWMVECGDKGQETELEAFKHMPKKLNQD